MPGTRSIPRTTSVLTQALRGACVPFSVWRLLTALFLFVAAGLHLAWLAADCPLDLAPDEAHYWDWSRNLDWSYYSKGPLVAWLIRTATEIAGTSVLAIRLPALLCGLLLLISLHVLTVQAFSDERLAAGVVGMALTMPAVTAVSSIMTIDAPYLCCWGWATVLGLRAIASPNSLFRWLLLGLVVGTGILAKYTMVLWPISLGLFLAATPGCRKILLGRGFWIMLLTAGLCTMPILVWNVRHDWVTFKHVAGLAGVAGDRPRFHWQGPLILIGTQFGILLGFWFAVWMAAMIATCPLSRGGSHSPILVHYLWWLSALTFAVFLGFSFKTAGGEPNWPASAYLSGLVLTAGWLRQQLQHNQRWRRRLLRIGLIAAVILGMGTTILAHYSAASYPLLGPMGDHLLPDDPLALRRFDPTCRLRGWQTLAKHVDQIREQLQEEGTFPVIAGSHWTLPGELGFYGRGNPTVYSLGPAVGDRRSQYDIWRPNPLADPDLFAGRTFILVGDFPATIGTAFDDVSNPTIVVHLVAGRPISRWQVRIGRGFRGFPDRDGRIAH